MHQVFAIFLRDVKRILKNPVALVVTLGVAIIPSLYAWCNILANWDPYANTGNIQVAVANEDKGTTSTLVGHLDAGQQTVNQLKKNHQLGWRFVPKQQAIEGVESGKYYAAIVLPEDFSSRLIGTVTGKGDRPSITYYINEKLNAIAPKITDTGATTIDEQINTTFVSSVADAVAKEVKEAAGETTGSVKSAQSDVINDLTDTINQLETVQQQLRDTRSTLDKALTTIDSAKQSNIALASEITNSLDTVGKASDLLSETRTQTERFSNTLVGALDNGSTQLSGLQVNVSNATGTVLSGLNTTQDALDQVSSTMHHVNATTDNVLDGVEKALQASQLDPNSQTYKDLSAQLAEARKQLTFQQQRIDAFDQDTTAAINAGKNTANGFNDDVTTLAKNGTASMASAHTTITGTVMPNLNTGLDTLSLANGSLSGTLTTLQSTLEQGNGLLDQLSRTVTQTNTTIAGTQTQLANLAKQLNTTRTDVAALSSSRCSSSFPKRSDLTRARSARSWASRCIWTNRSSTRSKTMVPRSRRSTRILRCGSADSCSSRSTSLKWTAMRRSACTRHAKAIWAVGCCSSRSDSCRRSSPRSAISRWASNASIRSCSSSPAFSPRSST